MCGIVGYFSKSFNVSEQKEYINWALSDMGYRGPDEARLWTDNTNYITGFNRLSIRDLSKKAGQPMVSLCKRYILSYNGEIYNSEPYKKKLIAKGVKFFTSSDTEILINSLIHFGLDIVLSEFDGIFAFAFYDSERKTLIIARDRAGVKPLYYGISNEGLIFSSQYNHVINHSSIKSNDINEGAIGSYLQFGYMVEGNDAIIQNTSFLPHGNYLMSDGISNKIIPYWKFPNYRKPKTNISLSEVINLSTDSQLVSDVPIGTFMSGGNDSTLITKIANTYNNGIKSFNIGLGDIKYDESGLSSSYAKIFKTDHKSKIINGDDMLALLDDNFKSFSEPFADFSSIPTLFLSKFAKKEVTVALSGDGGDELFWGYPRNYSVSNKVEYLESNRLLKTSRFIFEKLFSLDRKVTSKELRHNNFIDYYYNTLFIPGAAHWVPKIFNFMPNISKYRYEVDNKSNPFDIMRKLEYDLHLQRILIKVDRASMFNSLEVRVPLLGNKVIDKALEYSFDECVDNKKGKLPLKNILYEHVNQNLVDAPKKGFMVPMDEWIRTILKSEVEEKLMNIPKRLSIYFNRNQIHKMINQHNDGKYSWGWMIWALYSLIMWHEYHLKK